MVTKSKLKFNFSKRHALLSAIPVGVAILVVGVFALVNAAPRNIESESGTRSGNVTQISDSSASGSSAVKFNQPSGGGEEGECPVPLYTITASDVSSRLNSGYPAGTEVYMPGSPDPWGGCFPNAANTGIPAGTTLTNHTGSCTISANNTTLSARTFNCSLRITGNNVTIQNSKIVGSDINVEGSGFQLIDSEVDFGQNINGEGLRGGDLTVTRANMYGGKRQVWCNNCTLQDSYLHDQLSDPTGVTHESAARIDQFSTYRHNTLHCNAPSFPPDAGCSANQTGYPDFAPVRDIVLERNLYMATTGGYCSYGGSTNGKPFSNDPTNATNIRSIDNVFKRGTSPNDRTSIALTDKRRYTCGTYGATTAFNSGKTGFQFTGNRWDDGQLFVNDTTYPYGGFY